MSPKIIPESSCPDSPEATGFFEKVEQITIVFNALHNIVWL